MWQDKIQVKKGNIGESLVKSFLHNKGCIIYEPITEKAHGFDKLVSIGKDRLFIAEVKTKAKRNFYPDTGIDIRHYEEYKKISVLHNLPIFIFFVDESIGLVYGNFLSVLEKKKTIVIKKNGQRMVMVYPIKQGNIIYFYQPNMKNIAPITQETIEEIKKLSTRRYDYL
jgi:hypothetical protein